MKCVGRGPVARDRWGQTGTGGDEPRPTQGGNTSRGAPDRVDIPGFGRTADLHVMMNMFWEPLDFDVPENETWEFAIDTYAASPHDIADAGQRSRLIRQRCAVEGRSIVVLASVR